MGTLTAPDIARLRESAGRAADVLVENAVVADGQATWLSITLHSSGGGAGVVYRTGDATLYDGTAGIAMATWSVATPSDEGISPKSHSEPRAMLPRHEPD